MSDNLQITLTITLIPNGGGVQVSGPITDKILCYGLLAAAQDAIRDFKLPNEPKIAVPVLVVPKH